MVEPSDSVTTIGEERGVARRSFVERLSATVVGVSLAIVGCGPDSRGPTATSTGGLNGTGHLARLSASERLNDVPSTAIGSPSLSFLPDGYQSSWIMGSPADGFRVGPLLLDDQFALFFRSSSIEKAYRKPLVAYFATVSPGAFLAFTGGGIAPEQVEVNLSSRGSATARYWDGTWRLPSEDDEMPFGEPFWSREDGHSIDCVIDNTIVGVRAIHRDSVSRSDLIRVLEGIRFS